MTYTTTYNFTYHITQHITITITVHLTLHITITLHLTLHLTLHFSTVHYILVWYITLHYITMHVHTYIHTIQVCFDFRKCAQCFLTASAPITLEGASQGGHLAGDASTGRNCYSSKKYIAVAA